MKTIKKTIYQADDGTEYTSESAASERDTLILKVNDAMSGLGRTPKSVEAGIGWVQHNLETVNVAKDKILDICRELKYDDEYPVFKERGRRCHPLSIIGRILDDIGGPINTAWRRFARD